MHQTEILNDFLPDKIFDAHAHLYDQSFVNEVVGMPKNVCLEDYSKQMKKIFLDRQISLNIISFPSRKIISTEKIILKFPTIFFTVNLKRTTTTLANCWFCLTKVKRVFFQELREIKFVGLSAIII